LLQISSWVETTEATDYSRWLAFIAKRPHQRHSNLMASRTGSRSYMQPVDNEMERSEKRIRSMERTDNSAHYTYFFPGRSCTLGHVYNILTYQKDYQSALDSLGI
jgi:hypothetical protein